MTKIILLDTSILIANMRGVAAALDMLMQAQQAGSRLVASVVTRTELLAGVRHSERRKLAELLSDITWIPVNEDVADLAGEFARQYGKSHSTIDIGDYLIAATAKLIDADLKTLNIKHFPMFPNLQRPY